MIVIDWIAFVQVFVAALLASVLVVGFYSLGLRLLVRAGRAPVVAPAEFTDAITVITEKERSAPRRRRPRRRKKSPLTDGRSARRGRRVHLLRLCAARGARRPAADRLQPLSASASTATVVGWAHGLDARPAPGASPGGCRRMDAASVQFGQYPPARRTILHLSDTHLLAGNVAARRALRHRGEPAPHARRRRGASASVPTRSCSPAT